ncbi:hypothetical protein NL676_031993 [Syzygium grande]|nr:hypothetical protein NL676_031993 [Syzygium grande]
MLCAHVLRRRRPPSASICSSQPEATCRALVGYESPPPITTHPRVHPIPLRRQAPSLPPPAANLSPAPPPPGPKAAPSSSPSLTGVSVKWIGLGWAQSSGCHRVVRVPCSSSPSSSPLPKLSWLDPIARFLEASCSASVFYRLPPPFRSLRLEGGTLLSCCAFCEAFFFQEAHHLFD